jgi:putative FmdB family regulatory protein
MPLYNYLCEQCDELFEVRASFKEKEAGLEPECPQCHSKETRQLITAGLVLWGSNGNNIYMNACGPDAGPVCC